MPDASAVQQDRGPTAREMLDHRLWGFFFWRMLGCKTVKATRKHGLRDVSSVLQFKEPQWITNFQKGAYHVHESSDWPIPDQAQILEKDMVPVACQDSIAFPRIKRDIKLPASHFTEEQRLTYAGVS